MLTKFTVSNFKSFEKDFVFDLTDANGYAFNPECIQKGIVNNAIIYGHNGVGKSNLALALFDVIVHLTDRNRNEAEYEVYLNAYNTANLAEFRYELLINDCEVLYEYKKTDYKTLVYERFCINGEELAFIDRRISSQANIKFKGAEMLKNEISNQELSILKYVKNNTELDQNEFNDVFNAFFIFIDGMLFFRSLQDRIYLGLEVGKTNIYDDIIEKNNVQDFETFLNNAGIKCKLKVIDLLDKRTLAFDFSGKYIPFNAIASQGTKALSLFYFWLQRIREKAKVTFLFIDEFDAFYHYELSENIVRILKQIGVQFVLTTHNTSILSNDLLRPDCYFLMYKNKINSLVKSTSKELREAHNIEKMYKAGAFEEYE